MKKQEKKGADKSGDRSADKPKEGVDSFKVLLHNDDRTSMEFVVFILKSIFDKSNEEAEKIMMQVHNEAQGVAGSYSLDTARAKVMAVKMMARARCFPLQCTIEGLEEIEVPKRAAHHQLPAGWAMDGSYPEDYDVTIDTTISHSGTRCASVKNAVASPRGSGVLMQRFAPDDYRQKRLRMRMWVKTEEVYGRVQPWMRVDGVRRWRILGFDNFCQRHIEGTSDWKQCEIVLDVPEQASNIAFGIMLTGQGKVWIDDISFEVVGTDINTTDCPCNNRSPGSEKNPRNLGFEEE